MGNFKIKNNNIKKLKLKFFDYIKTLNLSEYKINSYKSVILDKFCGDLGVTVNDINKKRLFRIWKKYEKEHYWHSDKVKENSFSQLSLPDLQLGRLNDIENINIEFQSDKSLFELSFEGAGVLNVEDLNEIEKSNKEINHENNLSNIEVILDYPNLNEWRLWGSTQINIDLLNIWTKEELRNAITDALIKAKYPCIISYRTVNINFKLGLVIQYGCCKYKHHNQKFKFQIDNNKILKIFVKGESMAYHGEEKEYYQLRGQRREAEKNVLEHVSAQMTRLRQLKNIELDLLEQGNTQK